MTRDDAAPRANPAAIAARVVAGLIAAGAGITLLFSAWLVVSSRFGPAETDVHGYGLIFGTVLAIGAAALVSVALPWVFARGSRARAYWLCLALFVVVVIATLAMLATA